MRAGSGKNGAAEAPPLSLAIGSLGDDRNTGDLGADATEGDAEQAHGDFSRGEGALTDFATTPKPVCRLGGRHSH